MLTSRGRWFLVFSFALFAFSVFGQLVVNVLMPVVRTEPAGPSIVFANTYPIGLIAVVLISWFAWEWAAFLIGTRRLPEKIHVIREVHDEHGPADTLWVGKAFEVRVEILLRRGWSVPYVMLTERLPPAIDREGGDFHYEGSLQVGRPIRLTYRIRSPGVGQIRFEGLRLRTSDIQGFFHHVAFVHSVKTYRVLPPLADAKGHTATVKRTNLLPPPGYHRHKRPGSGSELLELHEYRPGDPPKTIAWKVSARRNRLITKEFESEVPLRCTLFVDTSNSVRVGARQTMR